MAKELMHQGLSQDKVLDTLRHAGVSEGEVRAVATATAQDLITLAEASERFGLPYSTLQHWLRVGRLRERGREGFHGPGGGKVLVDAEEVLYAKEHRRPRGRPRRRRKQQERRLTKAPDTLRHAGVSEGEVQAVATATAQDLITLAEASGRFGLPYSTLRHWVRVGHLPERGRERLRRPGGGRVLVDAEEVLYEKEKHPKRWLTKAPDTLRHAGVNEGEVQAVATATAQDLITLAEASERFGLRDSTLHHWLRVGHLRERGRERFPGPGGGRVLVDAEEVLYAKEKHQKRWLTKAPDTLRHAGVSEGEVRTVATAAAQDLITLAEASERFGLPSSTLHHWLRAGRLPERGREGFHGPGGGRVLVDAEEVLYAKEHPRERWLTIAPDTLRHAGEVQAMAPATAQDLITLAEASERFGLPSSTLHHWLRAGRLPERGRERFPGPGGSKVLLDAEEVLYAKEHPRPGGRPQERWLTKAPDTLRHAGVNEGEVQAVATATAQDLITLAEASERFGLRDSTLHHWLRVGNLRERGRERFHGPGGGKVLVDAEEVLYAKEHPRPGGRPQERWLTKAPDTLRHAGVNEGEVQAVATATAQDLITLAEASERFGLRDSTLHHWLRVGNLRERGRERFHGPGGGKVLVDAEEVLYAKEHPRLGGRPQKHQT